MGPRIRMVGLGLAVILGGSALSPLTGTAQETSSLSLFKRKIRSEIAPIYPPIARQMHLTGKVKIEATIAADGRVVNTTVVGGSPLLVNAAVDAIKRWRFEPGSKDTTETFEFDFDKPD
jgi:TonB family protein